MASPKFFGIVGAGGFIGSNLKQEFKNQGKKFIEFDRRNSILKYNNTLDPRLGRIDTLIWSASSVNPKSATEIPSKVIQEIDEWEKILELIHLNNLELRIIFLSSGGCVYSAKKNSFDEKDEAKGTNSYGEMKVKMEQSALLANKNTQILRLSNVYGPNQPIGRGQGVIAEWVNALENNRPIMLYGSLKNFRDYIYIDDVVTSICKISESDAKENIYNVGTGMAITLEEILRILSEQTGRSIEVEVKDRRVFDNNGYTLDPSRFSSEFNWKPKFQIEGGISRILENLLLIPEKR